MGAAGIGQRWSEGWPERACWLRRRAGCWTALKTVTARSGTRRVIYNGRTPALFNPFVSKQNYAASVGRLWDEGKQSQSADATHRSAAPDLSCRRLRPWRANLNKDQPQTSRSRTPADSRTWHGRVQGRTFRRRDERAAEPRRHLHCDLEVRAVRPCAAGGRALALRHRGQRYSELPRNLGAMRHSISAAMTRSRCREALALLHGNRELRLTYANRAYERARQRYTADRMVEEYMQLYRALLERRVWPHESGTAHPFLRALLDQRLEPRQRAFSARPGARAGAHGARGSLLRGDRRLVVEQSDSGGRSRRAAPSKIFIATYPELDVRFYRRDESLPAFLNHELAGADLVIIHEWNEPEVVHEILARKKRLGFRALFHDTHHRAYTNANQILRFQLHLFDGVLAFGEAIRKFTGMDLAWSGRGPFTRPPISASFIPWSAQNRTTWCGLATGATKSARRS